MNVVITTNANDLGRRAAQHGADLIRNAVAQRGQANIILATGASQFNVLKALSAASDVDWSKVTGFHLDEYIGLPASHPASFRRYLKERFVDRVPLAEFHYVNGDAPDPEAECQRLGAMIGPRTIDVAFIGIGENGHLAFNDPPADFDTQAPYLVVELDEGCRRQQLGEGWFATLEAVPRQAISMSIRQIMRSRAIVCSVPDQRKAKAVASALEGPVTPACPASILQKHQNSSIFLDPPAASLLRERSNHGDG
jgi:glucosamine-6-phosphate deaminase